ncbi:MAG: hypothetical protein GY847_13765 [Proteobacteria bacterium]|nr:hypothetical protein [Pseudomonadota bacterium]
MKQNRNDDKLDYNKTKAVRIPADWKCPAIGRVLEFSRYGCNAPASESGNTLVVGMKNLQDGKIQLSNLARVALSDEERRTFLLKRDDVLINRTNSYDLVGKVGIFDSDDEVAFVSYLVLLRGKPDIVNQRFLSYWLNSYPSQKSIKRIATKGVSQVNVNPTEFKKHCPIPLPTLPEQEAIAEVLECWDKAIRNYEKKIEKKRNIKKGLMQRLLSGKQRLPGFLGEWVEVRLDSLGATYSGLTGKTKHDFGVGKPFIPYMNIYSNLSVDLNALDHVTIYQGERQNRVKYGDLFFTTSSETAEEVGVASILLHKIENLYLNSFCFGFRLHNFEVLAPEFAKYYFIGANFRKVMFRIAQGASRYNLSKKYFLQTHIQIPDNIEEQQIIAHVLSSADSEIKAQEQKMTLLKDQKKFLLNNLVTGALRLPLFRDVAKDTENSGDNE